MTSQIVLFIFYVPSELSEDTIKRDESDKSQGDMFLRRALAPSSRRDMNDRRSSALTRVNEDDKRGRKSGLQGAEGVEKADDLGVAPTLFVSSNHN